MTPALRNVLLGKNSPFINFKASQFTTWKTGRSRVVGNTGRARIVCIGDSTTWGEGGGDAATARQNARANSFPVVMANRLAALGVATNSEGMWASGANFGSMTDADLRNYYIPGWNTVATWTIISGNTMGGTLINNAADTNALTYQPLIAVDTFELWDIVNTGLGIITWDVDGGATTQLDQNGSVASRRTTIPAGAAGTHTLNIKRVSGGAYWTGCRAWNSTVNAVDVFNIGRGSSTSADWIVNTVAYSSRQVTTQICSTADLVIIDLTINNEVANTAEATYKSEMQTLINLALAGGASVMLVTGKPVNPATCPQSRQDTFARYNRDLALLNNLPLLNMKPRYINYTTMVANSLMFNNLHMNKAGYLDLGTFMGDVVNTWGL